MTTTATVYFKQQSLNQDTTHCPIEIDFEILNDTEIDLESILSHEFKQGLSSDLETGY